MRFLIDESSDAESFIDRISAFDSHTAVGAVHALFLNNGANHSVNRVASAPMLSATQMKELSSYGRNQAGVNFAVQLRKRAVPTPKAKRSKS